MAAGLPLIVILGPTASGKSNVAMAIAQACGGEIVCADSRTVYRYADIGTAKPSQLDRAAVPHFGLDLVAPDQPFSVADFKQYAEAKIADIRSRGVVPIIVGGTGLYIDSLIFDYQFGPAANPEKRAERENMSLAELHEYCYKNNVTLPENSMNKRYVIRAIETNGISKQRRNTPIDNCIIVGITTEKDVLLRRIRKRSQQLFASGVIDEAVWLAQKYSWNNNAMTSNIYRRIHEYVDGTLSYEQLQKRNETSDWQLAKRQMTWFKRNPYITWLPLNQVQKYIIDHIA